MTLKISSGVVSEIAMCSSCNWRHEGSNAKIVTKQHLRNSPECKSASVQSVTSTTYTRE